MTSYGFNQNFSKDSLGSGAGGFGYGFSYGIDQTSPMLLLGIKNDLYIGYYNDDLSWFNDKVPIDMSFSTGAIADPFSDDGDVFSRRWTGYFKAPTTETYTFYLESDDASMMWIGNPVAGGWSFENAIVNNGGIHGMVEANGSIPLVEGTYYPIQVFFGENTGGDALTFSYSTDTIPKTADLSNLIYYNPNFDAQGRGI